MKEETKEKLVGEGVGFERIRRITGYLVGTVDRFNNGKRAEERDRVKHGTEGLLSNKSVSYTHLRAHETGRSRMPSSA